MLHLWGGRNGLSTAAAAFGVIAPTSPSSSTRTKGSGGRFPTLLTPASAPPSMSYLVPCTARTTLWAENHDTKEKEKSGSSTASRGIDEGLRTKLVAETIAPWRSVRLYFYGGLGFGALVGGLITLSGVAAALSGARTDLDLNTEVRLDDPSSF